MILCTFTEIFLGVFICFPMKKKSKTKKIGNLICKIEI